MQEIQSQAALSQKLYQRGFSWETIEQALEKYQNIAGPADSGRTQLSSG